VRLDVEVGDDVFKALRFCMERFGVSVGDVLGFGVRVLRLFFGVGRDYVVNTVREGGFDVDNVVTLGLELYFCVVERLLGDLGLSGCSIEDVVFTEDGCLSSIDVDPRGRMKCSEVFIWNHEEPLNVVLNYMYEKGRDDVKKWVKNLLEKQDELRKAVFKGYEFDIEGLKVEVDEDDEYCYIRIVIPLEEPIDVKKIEKRIEKVIGRIPKSNF